MIPITSDEIDLWQCRLREVTHNLSYSLIRYSISDRLAFAGPEFVDALPRLGADGK